MVDKTHYTDGSELTYKEKNHMIAFCTFFENYKIYYRTPPNYGEYVPLVHVLNHNNFSGDTLVWFFTITTSVHLLHTSKTSTSNYEVIIMFFNRNSRWIVCLIWCLCMVASQFWTYCQVNLRSSPVHIGFLKPVNTWSSKNGRNVWTFARRFLEVTFSERQELETG